MLKKRLAHYRPQKYDNPFFKKGQRRGVRHPNFGQIWLLKIIVFFIILFLFWLTWFFLFSDYFNIKSLNIISEGAIPSEEIKKSFWESTKEKRFLFGSQRNIFLFNKKEFIDKLNENFYFEELSLSRFIPDTFAINYKGKKHSMVWFENEKYYFINQEGDVMSSDVPAEDLLSGLYPIIENGEGKDMIADRKINNENARLELVFEIFNIIKKDGSDLGVGNFLFDSEKSTIKMTIVGGPLILFSIGGESVPQVEKLIAVKDKLKNDFFDKEYIDLRYGDRVYYK